MNIDSSGILKIVIHMLNNGIRYVKTGSAEWLWKKIYWILFGLFFYQNIRIQRSIFKRTFQRLQREQYTRTGISPEFKLGILLF